MEKLRPQDIGIIILAAGTSRRFNGDKRRAQLGNGLGLLEATLSRIPSSFKKKLLVLHNGDDELAQKFSTQGWHICIAEDSQQGMGNSLAAAMKIQDNCQGIVIGLGDMPYIKPETYSDIQNKLCSDEIVIPVFKGKRGNPVAFQEKYFSELGALSGDQGARKLLKKYESVCHRYESNDEGILKDIDTSLALEELSEHILRDS